MAGLNDLVTNKETQTTTMPSWYSTAQQNLVNQATGVTAPAIGDTAAQSAVSAFGTGSPFTAGQNILQSIGSGAANPWLVSTDATGAQTVTPNVSTPLGGLFSAQQSYLNKMMPGLEAERTAKSISGGDFGSRMNISGVEAERGKAMSDLAQKQMQAALQAQQYGVAAGAGLGNLGQEQVKSALETGTFQQNAPYAGAINLANILSKAQPDKNITKSVQLGGLNQAMGLLNLGSGAANTLLGSYTKDAQGNLVRVPGLLEKLGVKGGLSGLFPNLPNSPSGGSGGINYGGTTPPPNFQQENGGTYDPESGMVWYQGSDGQGYGIDSSNNYYDASGNLIWSPAWNQDYWSGWQDDGTGFYTNEGDIDWSQYE